MSDLTRSEHPGDPRAVRDWLRRSVLDGLGLDDVRVGRHGRSGVGAPTGRIVASVWLAHIAPAFDPAATLCIVRELGRRGYAFAVLRSRHAPLGAVLGVDVEVGKLEESWEDGVEAALGSVELFEISNVGITLDGIGYALELSTGAMHKASIEFGNPRTAGTRRLETALVSTLRSLAQDAPSTEVAEYVRMLERWTSGRNPQTKCE